MKFLRRRNIRAKTISSALGVISIAFLLGGCAQRSQNDSVANGPDSSTTVSESLAFESSDAAGTEDHASTTHLEGESAEGGWAEIAEPDENLDLEFGSVFEIALGDGLQELTDEQIACMDSELDSLNTSGAEPPPTVAVQFARLCAEEWWVGNWAETTS